MIGTDELKVTHNSSAQTTKVSTSTVEHGFSR